MVAKSVFFFYGLLLFVFLFLPSLRTFTKEQGSCLLAFLMVLFALGGEPIRFIPIAEGLGAGLCVAVFLWHKDHPRLQKLLWRFVLLEVLLGVTSFRFNAHPLLGKSLFLLPLLFLYKDPFFRLPFRSYSFFVFFIFLGEIISPLKLLFYSVSLYYFYSAINFFIVKSSISKRLKLC